ncbi:glycerophosphodiester phosphodiesterase family protein [Bdellovibrio sp. HCB274]|uniref:glycerophosphodiester phosphodiesterase family protein n=1 Tax=Bdellovibrio sp. HCB274 TaxID=3394361 RepID=UPI0039B514FC
MRLASIVLLSALFISIAYSGATPAKGRGLASVGLSTPSCLFAQKMEVHGHRGMNGYPDNTMTSFKAAFDAGVDVVELDLQVTRDNHILTAHDAVPNVANERCGLNGKSLQKVAIRDLDHDVAQNILCGIKSFDEATLAPMPELKEVFATFKDRKTSHGKPVRLNIEIKFFQDQLQYYPAMNDYLDLIIKDIRESGWSNDRFFVQSFNHEILKALKVKAPDIEVVPLVGDARNALKAAIDLGAKTVTPGFWQVNPTLIYELHKQNIKAIVWTPNQPAEIQQVIESGADGIITDYPEVFQKIRDELCSL